MTLIEVAKRARVSAATVSRVLNDTGPIKPSTRLRVLRAIEKYRYYPNRHARALARRTSRTLGLVVSNLENPFFVDIFRALEDESNRYGHEIAVANTNYIPRRLATQVRLMIELRMAGLAVVVSEMEPGLLQELRELNLPVVLFDVGEAGGRISKIKVNYQSGMRKVVTYLYSLGHRRMAFIGHHAGLQPLHERQKAFLETMKLYAGEVEFATATGPDGAEGGRQATRTLLASGSKPTAIVCTNDFMAIGVMKALREQGLKIPGDVSVTGHDNISLSEFVAPALTTLHVPRERIGRLAFHMLVPQPGESVIPGSELLIEPQLLVRDSTALAPGSDLQRPNIAERPRERAVNL
jgi:DNA-binding LacI/PurR family transcriptional regulator